MGKGVIMQWNQVMKPVASSSNLPLMKRLGVMVSYIGETYRWAKYEINGVAAYDIDTSSSWSPKEARMTLIGYGDSGLAYILAHGYPYMPIYGNADVDRFITQAAIWWYLADLGINSVSNSFRSSSPDPYGLRVHIKRLVEAAKDLREIGVGDVYSIGNEPLTACIFADNEDDSPHMVSLVCPNEYAEDAITEAGAVDLVSEALSAGKMRDSSSFDNTFSTEKTVEPNKFVILHDSKGSCHVLLGGVGLSNAQLNELIKKQVELGNIPCDAECSVSIVPSAPTPEMLTVGSTATMHHAGFSTGFMVGKAMQKGFEAMPDNMQTPKKEDVSLRASDKPCKHYVFREGEDFSS